MQLSQWVASEIVSVADKDERCTVMSMMVNIARVPPISYLLPIPFSLPILHIKLISFAALERVRQLPRLVCRLCGSELAAGHSHEGYMGGAQLFISPCPLAYAHAAATKEDLRSLRQVDASLQHEEELSQLPQGACRALGRRSTHPEYVSTGASLCVLYTTNLCAINRSLSQDLHLDRGEPLQHRRVTALPRRGAGELGEAADVVEGHLGAQGLSSTFTRAILGVSQVSAKSS